MGGGISPLLPLTLTGASMLGIGPKIGPRDPLTGQIRGPNLLGLTGLGLGIKGALAREAMAKDILTGLKTGVAPNLPLTASSASLISQITALQRAGVPPEVIRRLFKPNMLNIFRGY